jgi:hypothetical protein
VEECGDVGSVVELSASCPFFYYSFSPLPPSSLPRLPSFPRFLVQACQRVAGLRCFGVEYDSALCERARANVASSGLSSGQVSILHQSVLDADLSQATALFVYLVPEGIAKLRPALLQAMQRGARVVTYVFSVPDLPPADMVLYRNVMKVYLYKANSNSKGTEVEGEKAEVDAALFAT